MRKFFWFLLICLTGLSLSFIGYSQGLKIGYVDVYKVFYDCQKTQNYDQELEKAQKEASKELEEKKATIEKLNNKLSVVSEKERPKEQEKIQKEIQDLQEFKRKAEVDIRKDRDEKMKEIIEDINKVIENYAKKNNFSLIINKSAVLYGDKVMDISTDILEIVNKEYKK